MTFNNLDINKLSLKQRQQIGIKYIEFYNKSNKEDKIKNYNDLKKKYLK
tara:strand:- start:1838 stop:1984 length:147 start_codon:yes stop_codon:yes gene_type:complete